jgi:hypothetical protein
MHKCVQEGAGRLAEVVSPRACEVAKSDPEPDPVGMPRDDLLAYLRAHHTVSLWPFAGRALGVSRSLTYQLGHTETIRVLALGHRRRVASSWLEQALGLGEFRCSR